MDDEDLIEDVVEDPPSAITQTDLDNLRTELTPEPAPPPVAPQLTQDQMDEQLGRYRPDQQLVGMMLGDESTPEQKIAALEQMTQGIFKYSTNAANQLAMHHVSELRKELSPGISAAKASQENQWRNEFYTEHPTLKGHDELVEVASSKLRAAPNQPKTKKEAFKMLAETVTAIGQKLNPQFGKTSDRMANLATGGQGGQVPAGQRTKKGGAADIWD